MTEYVSLYEFYEIFLFTTFGKDKPEVCIGIKRPSSRIARETLGLGWIRPRSINDNRTLYVRFRAFFEPFVFSKKELCDPFIFYS